MEMIQCEFPSNIKDLYNIVLFNMILSSISRLTELAALALVGRWLMAAVSLGPGCHEGHFLTAWSLSLPGEMLKSAKSATS